jgi:hypothetical protein
MREHWWRFRASLGMRTLALLVLALLLGAIAILGGAATIQGDDAAAVSPLDRFTGTLSTLQTILAGLSAIGAFAFALSRTLLPGSSKAAQNYLETAPDPMETITHHFQHLVEWIEQPLVVFIDDLDRCDAKYVVRLLEGIQTLYRGAPVIYVVAADVRWLRGSYENTYKDFTGNVDEPGHPLGHLFMEKIFQLSAPVPGMLDGLRQDYWNNLMVKQETSAVYEAERQAVADEAQAALNQLTSDQAIVDLVKQQAGDDLRQQVYRAEAIKRLVAPEVQLAREHRLQRYLPLVGHSPRAMKRMVNFYTIQQSLNTLTGSHVSLEDLPLWAILVMRWPYLAEYLAQHPQTVCFFDPQTGKLPRSIPLKLRPLFQDAGVLAVVNGQDVAGSLLDETVIRRCASLGS